ncbi:MAG TPA: hypothetical protein VH661_10660 [Candidatus Dormibacteraeota bacterium]|nr:hypothetical protein [Candidatus Dormibacteraeota bacterium]
MAATAARRPFLPNMGALWGGGDGGGGGINVLSLSMVDGPFVDGRVHGGDGLGVDGDGGIVQALRFMAVLRDLADDAMLVSPRADCLSAT